MKRIPVMEIMSKKTPMLEPTASVEDAAAKMQEKGAGCIIVSDQGKPVGIVTERDIVYKVVSERKNPAETKLEDVMSSPIIWIPRHTDIMNAAKKMTNLKLRRLVVMHEGAQLICLSYCRSSAIAESFPLAVSRRCFCSTARAR